jgi:hypothetical protein
MADTNIYDRHITELFFRIAELGTGLGSGTAAKLQLSWNQPYTDNETLPGYTGNHSFTSTVINMPAGYSVKSGTHVITYPTASPTVGSIAPLIGSGILVDNLAAIGDTYTVTSSVILERPGNSDIVLNASLIITAAAPFYWGIIDGSATLTPSWSVSTASSLSLLPSGNIQFQMPLATGPAYFHVGLPTGLGVPNYIVDGNGNAYPIADWTQTNSTGVFGESIEGFIYKTYISNTNATSFWTLQF